jgi:hypothetical protein
LDGFANAEDERQASLQASAREQGGWEPVPQLPDHVDLGETESVVALLGGAVRKGAWEPAESVRVLALMGAVTLDFRDAELLEGVTEISVLAIMGGVQIVVPPELALDVNGLGLMGSFQQLARRRSQDPTSPLLRVRGVSLMGGVHLKVA